MPFGRPPYETRPSHRIDALATASGTARSIRATAIQAATATEVRLLHLAAVRQTPPSLTLCDTLTARRLETAAKLVGRAGRYERPHHGAIINPLRTEIGAFNHGGPAAKLARKF